MPTSTDPRPVARRRSIVKRVVLTLAIVLMTTVPAPADEPKPADWWAEVVTDAVRDACARK